MAAPSQLVGQTLGHYRILEQIGAGGMGVVYRAHDTRLDRNVALKILPLGALADEAARKRFRKEALTLSKLSHSNIAHVYDFDALDGLDFLVMEYVDGVTLANKLGNGALREKEVLSLAEQIATTLEDAHEHGIIHRDLKPSNIMLTLKGQVKLLDFGLAKLLQPPTAIEETESLTRNHVASGTLPYMAPEQLLGEPPDVRSDIYALGSVLYEMATGHRPFEAKVSTSLADDIIHKPASPPGRLNPSLSPRLEEVILKCLEKDPPNRYQSAKELAVDLRRLATPRSVPVEVRTVDVRLRRRRAVTMMVIAIVGVSTLLFILNVGGSRDRLLGRSDPPHIESIAVLPLENLSHDPAQEYFADSMTEALITDLGKIGALRVISRTSVMRYKSTKKPVPEIARELNVDAVVEGSVGHFGDRVRITANLLHAPTDRHLWAESYERDLHDMLTLQSEVARAIAQEIRIKLTPQEKARLASSRPTDPSAYRLYLKGRNHLETWTEPGIKVAIDYFEQAIQKDPSFALAYAGLAEAAVRGGGGVQKARPAALQALQMDDELSEAHAMIGLVRFRYDWDWQGAESEFRRAIELNPNSMVAHHYHAHNLLVMGRTEEALVEDKRWIELDPFSPAAYEHLGWDYVGLRRYDEGIQVLHKALQLDPNFPEAIYSLALAYVGKGMLGEAIAQLRRAIDLSPRDLRGLGGLGHAYALSGRRDKAWEILKQLKGSSTGGYNALWVAEVYAALGDKDQAFEWLEKVYRDRDFTFEFLKYEPYWESLRSDTRFQDLLQRIGVP